MFTCTAVCVSLCVCACVCVRVFATSDRSSWRTLCHKAVTDFEDTRVAALVQHWCTSELSASSTPSLPVVSVFGRATAAPESVVPESGFLPIRRRTGDSRSVVLDEAVHVFGYVCIRFLLFPCLPTMGYAARNKCFLLILNF